MTASSLRHSCRRSPTSAAWASVWDQWVLYATCDLWTVPSGDTPLGCPSGDTPLGCPSGDTPLGHCQALWGHSAGPERWHQRGHTPFDGCLAHSPHHISDYVICNSGFGPAGVLIRPMGPLWPMRPIACPSGDTPIGCCRASRGHTDGTGWLCVQMFR